jgi:hypothetical protein
MDLNTITLTVPIAVKNGDPISTVELRRPTVGALRGMQLSLVQMLDVNAMITLIPRITVLTPAQVEGLDPADFAAIANRIALFFMSADQLAAVQATMT